MFRILLIAIVSICVPLSARAYERENREPRRRLDKKNAFLKNPVSSLKSDDSSRNRSVQLLARLEESNYSDESFSTVRAGVPPGLLTSDAPPSSVERAEGDRDLAWLQGLELPDIPVRWDDRVINLLDYYRISPKGQAHIKGWFERMNRYERMIRRKLQKASLPEDLVFVAMVESGFDASAQSDAGALGMWQFVEITADEYGLERSRWVDQRMNPERSTDAAIKFLRDLYSRFGSWELSLAAYNMGYGSLLRAIKKYNSNDFWLLSRLEAGLPYETVYYVANVMACSIIGRNPERFGIPEPRSSPAEELSFVVVPGGIGLRKLARAAAVTKDELAALNPELKKSRIPPDVREWTIRIPASRRARFLQKLEKARLETDSHDRYTVRFGEQLSDVARRFDTTSSALQRLNGLGADERVGPGFQLLVPAVKPVEPNENESPPIVAVPDQTFVYTDRRRIFYRVTSQDTVSEIARFFRVTEDELRRWNWITKEASLQRGMILQLFVPKNTDLSKAVVLTPNEVKVLQVGSDEFFDYHEAQRDRVRIRYRVRPGDTLSKIAKRFELSVGSIARINRFSSKTLLRADQEIIVYVPKKQE